MTRGFVCSLSGVPTLWEQQIKVKQAECLRSGISRSFPLLCLLAICFCQTLFGLAKHYFYAVVTFYRSFFVLADNKTLLFAEMLREELNSRKHILKKKYCTSCKSNVKCTNGNIKYTNPIIHQGETLKKYFPGVLCTCLMHHNGKY